MTSEDRKELFEAVSIFVDAAVNKRLVNVLTWIVVVTLMNFGAVVGGIVFALNDRQQIIARSGDRWTATMEEFSESVRSYKNPAYSPVDVRAIQEAHRIDK